MSENNKPEIIELAVTTPEMLPCGSSDQINAGVYKIRSNALPPLEKITRENSFKSLEDACYFVYQQMADVIGYTGPRFPDEQAYQYRINAKIETEGVLDFVNNCISTTKAEWVYRKRCLREEKFRVGKYIIEIDALIFLDMIANEMFEGKREEVLDKATDIWESKPVVIDKFWIEGLYIHRKAAGAFK